MKKFVCIFVYYSYQEFLEQTKKPNFQQDEGWQGLDEQQMYSKEEYEVFQKRRQEEIQNMIAKGMVSLIIMCNPV